MQQNLDELRRKNVEQDESIHIINLQIEREFIRKADVVALMNHSSPNNERIEQKLGRESRQVTDQFDRAQQLEEQHRAAALSAHANRPIEHKAPVRIAKIVATPYQNFAASRQRPPAVRHLSNPD